MVVQSVDQFTGLSLPIPALELPIGISFYTFQAMSYVIDVYRGEGVVSQTESGAAVNDGYEMQLILADGSTLEYTTVPFADMDVCTLHLEDGVPYLEYTSLSSPEEISTQETEAAAQQAAQQQAQQEAAAKQEQGQQQEEQGCLAGALISLSFEKEG